MNRSVLELRVGGLPFPHGGGELRLGNELVAVAVHAGERRLITASAGPFLERVAFVDIDRPSPQEWAIAAFTAARRLA